MAKFQTKLIWWWEIIGAFAISHDLLAVELWVKDDSHLLPHHTVMDPNIIASSLQAGDG